MNITYTPAGETIRRFHLSKAFFRGIRGPIGSGKTVACCYELLHMAMQQQPSPLDGWRRTRWLVLRNTYPELRLSTAKTWLSVFPENAFGRFMWSPPFRHRIVDETQKFEMDVYFVALDDEDNVRDLLSTEWTGAFANEAREFPKALIDNVISRLRRYPEMRTGGPTRPGIVADTNAPGAEHWWPVLSGEVPMPDHFTEEDRRLYVKPKSWEFFTQPPAILERKKEGLVIGYRANPKAENLANLHPDYYREQWEGKDRDWINVYLLNRYQDVRAGKPVYPEFSQDLHVFKEHQTIGKGRFKRSAYDKTFIGIDFGLTPAAVVLQRSNTGRYRVIAEFVAENMTIPRFGEWLGRELAALGLEPDDYEAWGDPSGDYRDQQGDTAFALMRAAGIQVMPAPTNDPSIRIGAVSAMLTRLVDKRVGFRINAVCVVLIQGFVHGYRYPRLRVTTERYHEKPEKNRYSHVHDALQYAALGAGEGRNLMGAHKKAPVVTKERATRIYAPGGGQRGRGWDERTNRKVIRW